ncbi:hypothetical protein F2P56_034321 [Juglans regia]|uniref:Protein FAR-RED IMPAIRED RESPONSE 1-like n=2 Tax=Juglans regia TaxID=51240 RepID=A0A2I4GZK6_JUGRE|nr:protein FAR-RED IMPAIRED RESPONSE 1-like [Juglans regia]KAF5445256.1 hypothetical protein F2P56_034321 [Juglans regia]
MARINSSLNDEGGYTLTKVKLDHIDVCSPGKARYFRCFNNVDARVAKRLEINNEASIRVSKNLKVVVVEVGAYENVPFGENECWSYIVKALQLRLEVGGVETLCNYFQDMQSKNLDFYYRIDVDHELWLKNVFWTNARSRVVNESFGEVITFDTTYLTNAYKIPFALFVGVNYHAYVRDTFWAGISMTQRSESMNALFNDYVNSKTTLKQFVDQYDSALRRNGGRYTFVVADVVQVHDDLLKHANYTVKLGKSTVPSKYILDWLRKDVKSKYTFVKSNYDTSNNHDAQRYDRIQNYFYELCSNASKVESSTGKLISQLEHLKVEYPSIVDHDTSNTVDPSTTMEGMTGKVLNSLIVRSKGRPPSRRKVHPIEKTFKKPSTRRRL